MPNFEPLETIPLASELTHLYSHNLPELVYVDDPATDVMIDMRNLLPNVIDPKANIDKALDDIKQAKIPALMVINREGDMLGIITGQDIYGTKPIKIIEERRISRDKITVEMIMTPIEKFIAFPFEDVEKAKVGNIITGLKANDTNYAFSITHPEEGHARINGVFLLSQISKQVHRDLSELKATDSVLELEERRKI